MVHEITTVIPTCTEFSSCKRICSRTYPLILLPIIIAGATYTTSSTCRLSLAVHVFRRERTDFAFSASVHIQLSQYLLFLMHQLQLITKTSSLAPHRSPAAVPFLNVFPEYYGVQRHIDRTTVDGQRDGGPIFGYLGCSDGLGFAKVSTALG